MFWSYILYIVLGCIGAISLYYAKEKELTTGKKQKLLSKSYIIWWILWTIIATFRYVAKGYGGSDAIDYLKCFYNGYDQSVAICAHYDVLFRSFGQLIRIIFNHHYFYFFITYGIFVFSYIFLFNELTPKKTNFSPYILTIFIFLRGFTSIRTNLAASIILFSIVLYKKNYKILAYIFTFLTFFIQKASILYLLLFVFLEYTKRKKVSIKECLLLVFGSFLLGKIAQYVLTLDFVGDLLNGAYSSYAERSLHTSFFDNYWKICFGQLVLLFCIVVFNKILKKDITNSEKIRRDSLELVYNICMFDFITIPISYILSIWRGYEYLYLVRLIMWGEIIYLLQTYAKDLNMNKIRNYLSFIKLKKVKKYLDNISDVKINKVLGYVNSKTINFVCTISIIGWFIFRLYNTWQSSCLMPYVFEPFLWFK